MHEHRPVTTDSRTPWQRAAGAVALAGGLSACWAWRGWAEVSRLVLPDGDDMMRLAQVRDWIGGQALRDWTQYRLGPGGGAPMHWSRIDDIGIAAILQAATPFAGRHAAEVAAVILYPALLFAAFLWLSATIAGVMIGRRGVAVAMIVAALAYPAASLFQPGRIDHHGLQIVLTLGAALALMRADGWRSGAVAGTAIALSLGIGLETIPQVAALLAAAFFAWVAEGRRQTLIGLGGGLAGVTALLVLLTRPTLWSPALCDTFSPGSTTASMAGGLMLAALAWRSPATPLRRLLVGAAAGAVVLAAVLAAFPACLHGPYALMDPFVSRAFIDNVTEARGLFGHPLLGMGLASCGMTLAGVAAAGWWLWRHPAERMRALPLAAVLLASALVALFQVRGAYIGSAAAPPFLAALILAARAAQRGRSAALVGAWAVSAGMLWLVVPGWLGGLLAAPAPAAAAAAAVEGACTTPASWAELDAEPPGLVMAPMEMGAFVIAATRHRSVAAAFHRNDAGNRASYAFFLSPPERAHRIAAAWGVRYVAICPSSFAELGLPATYRASIAPALREGRAPDWLERLPLREGSLRLYRVRR